MNARSLYLHFPFCERKCHYCDFYSLGRDCGADERIQELLQWIENELWRQTPMLAPQLETLYIGGGTPSLMSSDQLADLLRPVRGRITKATEWTLEANPSSVTASSLHDYKKLGVNRLSIGIQSLNPALLKRLGRVHTREAALEALENAFIAGFENVSVDLLCGVPDQDLAILSESLTRLAEFPIKHLSCYLLTLTPGNPLFSKLPDEETQLEHLLHIDEWLGRNGFEHYEISNFSKPGWRSRHNLNYWRGEPYLAVGPSAHSFDPSAGRAGKRWKNISSIDLYEARLQKGELPRDWDEELTPEQREIERWMLALRLNDGFPATWLDSPERQTVALKLRSEHLLEAHPTVPGNLRLTPRGLALSDEIVSSLI